MGSLPIPGNALWDPEPCSRRREEAECRRVARVRLLTSAATVALLLALTLAGAGCMTPMNKSLFTAAGPGWTIREGQALWRPGRKYPELAGEIIMARNPDGRCGIQFTKTTLPVVLAQTTGAEWLIQFPPERLSFGGRGAPPRRFTWLYLPAALAGRPLPKNFVFQNKPDGGWRLENTSTGETLDGFLSP